VEKTVSVEKSFLFIYYLFFPCVPHKKQIDCWEGWGGPCTNASHYTQILTRTDTHTYTHMEDRGYVFAAMARNIFAY